MTDHEKWIKWIQKQMQSVVPASLKRGAFQPKDGDIRHDFYKIICNKACLNHESYDVLEAFIELYPLREED